MNATKTAAAAFLGTLLAGCGTIGTGSSQRLSANEKSVLLAAYQNPVEDGNGEKIAAWARQACQGKPPPTALDRAQARCRELSDSAAYVLANQGKYAAASALLNFEPMDAASVSTEYRGLLFTVDLQQSDIRSFNKTYLAFLVADGTNRSDTKELMYDAYLRSISFPSALAHNPARFVDTPIRPFNLENFPRDAERLDGPQAAKQARIFLEDILKPLDQAVEEVYRGNKAEAGGGSGYAAQVVLYEYGIDAAKKRKLESRYISYLEKRKETLAYLANAHEKNNIK